MKKFVKVFCIWFAIIFVLSFVLHKIIIPEESFSEVLMPTILLGLVFGFMIGYASSGDR